MGGEKQRRGNPSEARRQNSQIPAGNVSETRLTITVLGKHFANHDLIPADVQLSFYGRLPLVAILIDSLA